MASSNLRRATCIGLLGLLHVACSSSDSTVAPTPTDPGQDAGLVGDGSSDATAEAHADSSLVDTASESTVPDSAADSPSDSTSDTDGPATEAKVVEIRAEKTCQLSIAPSALEQAGGFPLLVTYANKGSVPVDLWFSQGGAAIGLAPGKSVESPTTYCAKPGTESLHVQVFVTGLKECEPSLFTITCK